MWCLSNEVESTTSVSDTLIKESPEITVVESDASAKNLSIACDGTVINKYPGFRDTCQSYLDQLSEQSHHTAGSVIRLDPAPESAILGAAVAVAVAVADKSEQRS
jgi:hexokinase